MTAALSTGCIVFIPQSDRIWGSRLTTNWGSPDLILLVARPIGSAVVGVSEVNVVINILAYSRLLTRVIQHIDRPDTRCKFPLTVRKEKVKAFVTPLPTDSILNFRYIRIKVQNE